MSRIFQRYIVYIQVDQIASHSKVNDNNYTSSCKNGYQYGVLQLINKLRMVGCTAIANKSNESL